MIRGLELICVQVCKDKFVFLSMQTFEANGIFIFCYARCMTIGTNLNAYKLFSLMVAWRMEMMIESRSWFIRSQLLPIKHSVGFGNWGCCCHFVNIHSLVCQQIHELIFFWEWGCCCSGILYMIRALESLMQNWRKQIVSRF
jgi:hypothetical protein